MRTTLRAERSCVRRLCFDAAFLCVALMLSYAESLLPINLILPLPGFRLGLANVVVTVAFFCMGYADAAIISAAKIFINALLFGNAVSILFSSAGGVLAFAGLLIFGVLLKNRLSYIGLSVACAALHNFGQILCAMLIFGTEVILTYLPALLLASVFFGTATGFIINAAMPSLERIIKGGSGKK